MKKTNDAFCVHIKKKKTVWTIMKNATHSLISIMAH